MGGVNRCRPPHDTQQKEEKKQTKKPNVLTILTHSASNKCLFNIFQPARKAFGPRQENKIEQERCPGRGSLTKQKGNCGDTENYFTATI